MPSLLRTLLVLGCCLVLGLARTAVAQEGVSAQGVIQGAQEWVDAALRQGAGVEGAPLRLHVSLGQLDARLRLAPCERMETYLPTNTRLWGKTRIGLRCLEGRTHWNVFLPVTVQAQGPAWVLRTAIAAGSVLKAEDAVLDDVDWASESASVLADPALWVGQVAAYPLQAGQALRQTMVRPALVFQVGANLRVLAQGAGFSVSSDAQALGAGAIGQAVRVRTESGRVLSGVVLDAHTVKVSL